jgi:hypothetical protein
MAFVWDLTMLREMNGTREPPTSSYIYLPASPRPEPPLDCTDRRRWCYAGAMTRQEGCASQRLVTEWAQNPDDASLRSKTPVRHRSALALVRGNSLVSGGTGRDAGRATGTRVELHRSRGFSLPHPPPQKCLLTSGNAPATTVGAFYVGSRCAPVGHGLVTGTGGGQGCRSSPGPPTSGLRSLSSRLEICCRRSRHGRSISPSSGTPLPPQTSWAGFWSGFRSCGSS